MRALLSFDEALMPALMTVVFQIAFVFIGLSTVFGAFAVITAINTAGFFTARAGQGSALARSFDGNSPARRDVALSAARH